MNYPNLPHSRSQAMRAILDNKPQCDDCGEKTETLYSFGSGRLVCRGCLEFGAAVKAFYRRPPWSSWERWRPYANVLVWALASLMFISIMLCCYWAVTS